MRTETTLVTAAMFVAGVLLGWLAASRKSRRFCTSRHQGPITWCRCAARTTKSLPASGRGPKGSGEKRYAIVGAEMEYSL
jgi:hypothetical protein